MVPASLLLHFYPTLLMCLDRQLEVFRVLRPLLPVWETRVEFWPLASAWASSRISSLPPSVSVMLPHAHTAATAGLSPGGEDAVCLEGRARLLES